MGYAKTLRALGQALESLNLGDFSVEPDGEGYRVIRSNGARNLGVFQGGGALPLAFKSRSRLAPVELSYSPDDVERLDRDGRAQRSRVQGRPDNPRLSQALRTIGAYLNQKSSRLLQVSRRGESFEVLYESSLGSRYSVKFTAADLYDLWVRFYLQRSARCV